MSLGETLLQMEKLPSPKTCVGVNHSKPFHIEDDKGLSPAIDFNTVGNSGSVQGYF